MEQESLSTPETAEQKASRPAKVLRLLSDWRIHFKFAMTRLTADWRDPAGDGSELRQLPSELFFMGSYTGVDCLAVSWEAMSLDHDDRNNGENSGEFNRDGVSGRSA